MRIACWIPKATNIDSEYIIFIAPPLQQWLHKTRHNVTLYVHCLSFLNVTSHLVLFKIIFYYIILYYIILY
jgi:hypothetical protein